MIRHTTLSLTPQVRLVVLDLDGTLYAKPHMVWYMLFAAPCEWRIMLAERKTRKQMRGQWMGDEDVFYQTFFQTMAVYCGVTPDKLREWYFNRYMPLMVNIIRKHYKLAEWFFPFVSECKNQGVCLVVLSDYGHTHEKLASLGLDEKLFDWVISTPELGGLKPASQLITLIMDQMGVMPDQCLIIGDRDDTDGQLAKSVGANFYLV
jgi:FMN phosphatase YigB (HAD superfamily)